MSHALKALSVVLFFLVAPQSLAQVAEGRLMRFPDVHGDRVAFSYGGDLWLATTAGGVARRITSHSGQELFPKFSPDGKWIAFTGQYDGNFNVYVIPAEGGEPRQLTFHPGGPRISERMGIPNQVITWTPDSKRVLFLTRQDTFNTWFGRLYSVSVDGGLPEPFPLDKGGLTSFSPDGQKIAYNRIFRNFRTWKRYRGGLAQDISIYDLKTHELTALPHEAYTDTFPMWKGDTIYFDSDRGAEHRLNLWAYSVSTRQVRQLTHYTDFDVNWPSLGQDSIIFENAGWLFLLDLKTEQARKLTLSLPGDRDRTRRRWVNASKLVTDFDLSPDGKRAVFTARGEVFTVPAKEGSIRDLTRSPGVREKNAVWSPDGTWVAYFSDRTGEDELYLAPQDGIGREVRVTTDGKHTRIQPVWSPDARKLAFADKETRLFVVDVMQKKPVQVAQSRYSDVNDYAFSPDGKWLVYALAEANNNHVIYLYNLATARSTPVTSNASDSYSPAFDPEGKYLYFLSNRDFNAVPDAYDSEFANPKTGRVYAVTLRADLPPPLPVLSDEVTSPKPPDPQLAGNEARPTVPADKTEPEDKTKDGDKSDGPGKRAPLVGFRIDLDGIQNRTVALPIPPGNLRSLGAAKGLVFYVTAPVQGLSGPLPGESPALHVFDLKERKDHVFMEGVDRFALSFDGKKLLFAATKAGEEGGGEEVGEGGEHSYGIAEVKAPDKEPFKATEGVLKLDGMRMEIDPRAEWQQIFNEVWRLHRDYFFEAAMNGVDWKKEHDKYAQLLPFVADRYSLTYVLGELIGELSNSHTYVGGGEYPELETVNVGLLGADFAVEPATGLYRIAKIYPGENWNRSLRSPLTEPGVQVKQGEYLLAVNSAPLKAPLTPYQLLVNTVNDVVNLTVNDKPTLQGARIVRVRPIGSELELHELDWIATNRKKVSDASQGRIGYVYIPDMGDHGLNEFTKQFFPQIRKQALIVDVRYNGGGFVDQVIFERLRRTVVGMETDRNFESGTIPDRAFLGPMACLTNHYAASDGDFFSYYWKVYKMGPLIGERTWGGVRGIRGYMPLIDGGFTAVPESALYGMDSKWLIENRGVEPEITVDNLPGLVLQGRDPQLEKAIELLLKQIQEHPPKLPPRPPDLPAYPDGPG